MGLVKKKKYLSPNLWLSHAVSNQLGFVLLPNRFYPYNVCVFLAIFIRKKLVMDLLKMTKEERSIILMSMSNINMLVNTLPNFSYAYILQSEIEV